MAERPSVLHVSEAFGGGIVSAIDSYVRSTSDRYAHFGIFRSRDEHKIGDERSTPFVQMETVSGSLFRFYMSCISSIRSVRPDIVHLHSSFAGLIGRVLPPMRSALVYSPHCYGFERLDISPAVRTAAKLFELVAARRLNVLAAIGDYEAELTRRFPFAPEVVTLRNAVKLPETPPAPIAASDGAVTVGMLGRANEQKGVDFFLETVRRMNDQPLRFKWIGGAQRQWESRLLAAGVEVTGWVERSRAIAHLAGLDVYFHTAAWEGTPVSILEAAALRRPIVARSIPHLVGLPLPVVVDDPSQAAAALVSLLNPVARQKLALEGAAISESHSVDRMRASLIECYEHALHAQEQSIRFGLARSS
jgi:glycosyltransferase involved in cell wall biosynthesis